LSRYFEVAGSIGRVLLISVMRSIQLGICFGNGSIRPYMPRTIAFGVYSFFVSIIGGKALGGFSTVSGSQIKVVPANYRAGSDATNHPLKILTFQNVSDVTLKRGVVDSSELWSWIQAARTNAANAKRNVSITQRDQSGQALITWQLQAVAPVKYTGPSLAVKGGGDVAIEELVLSSERLVLPRK
jgi:phage tail-like protein